MVCGEEMPASQILGHVRACSRANADELQAQAVEEGKDMFTHDDEHYEWLRARHSG